MINAEDPNGRPLVVRNPSPDDKLPLDNRIWDDETESWRHTDEQLLVSTSPELKVCGFRRAAQAACLLGRVLDFVAKPNADSEATQSEITQMDFAIQRLIASLLQDAKSFWDTRCEAIGTCMRYVSKTFKHLSSRCEKANVY
jgi:hypothetical protein